MITSTMIPSTAEIQAGNTDIRTNMLIFIRRPLTVQAVAATGLALKKKKDGYPVPHDEKPKGNIPEKKSAGATRWDCCKSSTT